MGRYEDPGLPWWERLRLFEPAMVRAVVVAVVGVLALWGVDAADVGERVSGSWELLFAVLPIVQGWWTRTVVSPSHVNDIG